MGNCVLYNNTNEIVESKMSKNIREDQVKNRVKQDQEDDDDWETDPDYVNDVSEQEQRWGGRKRDAGAIDMDQFRKDILKEDDDHHKKKVAGTNQAIGYRPDKDAKK